MPLRGDRPATEHQTFGLKSVRVISSRVASDAVAHPLCPRCGYDVSGPVPDWTESCPVRGQCSECGQGFAWGEVFFPDRNDLRGFFEHARRTSTPALIGSAWRTWAWAMAPWGFYRRVLVTHRIVWLRLATWLVWLIVPLHAAAATLATVRIVAFPVAGLGARGMGGASGDWSTYLSCWTYPMATVDLSAGLVPGASPGAYGVDWMFAWTPLYVVAALAAHAMFALMCLALPWTLGAAKVRRGHIARAFVYGLAWLPLLAVFRVLRNAYLILELTDGATLGMTGLGWGGPRPMRLAEFYPEVLAPVLLGWVAVWWAAVFVRGWRIKGAWSAWGLLSVAAAVMGAAAWIMLSTELYGV